jgi:hypothetical protein
MQRLQHAYSMKVYIPTCFDLSNLSRHILTLWLKVPKVVPLTFFQCTYLCGGHCEQHDEHHRSDPSRIMLMPQLREPIHISSLNYVIVSLFFSRVFPLSPFFKSFKALGWADDKCILLCMHSVFMLFPLCTHYVFMICFHMFSYYAFTLYILKCINISNRAADHIAIFLYIFVQLTGVFVAVSLSIVFWGRSIVVERRDRFPSRGPYTVPRGSKWMCQLMSRASQPWKLDSCTRHTLCERFVIKHKLAEHLSNATGEQQHRIIYFDFHVQLSCLRAFPAFIINLCAIDTPWYPNFKIF